MFALERAALVTFALPKSYRMPGLGHELGGVAGRYSHVTAPMRDELMRRLTEQWNSALADRAAISMHSPVLALEALLQSIARTVGKRDDSKIVSQSFLASG